MSLENEVGAYEQERLEQLAAQPNTTVFKTEYGNTHESWKVRRLRRVAEALAIRVIEFSDDVSDFQGRKRCMGENEEVLQFQRDHPRLYWLMTDRKMVRDKRFQQAFGAMLKVKEGVESGKIEEGRDADAMVTSSIVSALQQ